MIEDHLGRSFKKLRISLNSICNFACTYCVSDKEVYSPRKAHTGKSLAAREFAILVSKLHSNLNLQEIRLTGGEPTLYPELVDLVYLLKEIGIPKVALTTNGYLLSKLARDLKKAGLDSMNISLDAVDPDIFFKMSRGRKLEKTLEGIHAAKENQIPFKLNATIMKGYNENEILPLLEFSGKLGVTVRYLELMKMGHLSGKTPEDIFTEKEILDSIATRHKFEEVQREKSSTANYWITKEGYKFGIIANESSPFCGDCNRLRLDSQGSIYGCLSSNHAFSIREAVNSEIPLEPILYQALLKKQDYKFSGSSLGMMSIGG
jgi:cyclic pyranopterin phosphate synthase